LHPARAFHEADPAVLASRVAERGFAVIVGTGEGRPVVAHAPVLLDEGRLRFHLSAANPLGKALQGSGWGLAVITGADTYVSPDWYELPDQVPTWNYLSVEIEGPVRALERRAATALLEDLSARYEADLAPKPPWTRAKLDPAKFETLLSGIVAFEMTVERLEGITKLSQNKPPEAVQRVARYLVDIPDAGASVIAAHMLRPRASE